MPKIIYRPNPTPPPFVPPTPPISTTITGFFNPLPYTADSGVLITFREAVLPSFSYFTLGDLDNDISGVILPSSQFSFNKPVAFEPENNYDPGTTYFLVLLDENEQILYKLEIIIENKP